LIHIELSEEEKDELLPPLYKVEVIDSEVETLAHQSTINFLP